jgi:hypothetical protein
MSPAIEHAFPCHYRYNNIDYNTRENVEAVEAGYRKKEIGKIG